MYACNQKLTRISDTLFIDPKIDDYWLRETPTLNGPLPSFFPSKSSSHEVKYTKYVSLRSYRFLGSSRKVMLLKFIVICLQIKYIGELGGF